MSCNCLFYCQILHKHSCEKKDAVQAVRIKKKLYDLSAHKWDAFSKSSQGFAGFHTVARRQLSPPWIPNRPCRHENKDGNLCKWRHCKGHLPLGYHNTFIFTPLFSTGSQNTHSGTQNTRLSLWWILARSEHAKYGSISCSLQRIKY